MNGLTILHATEPEKEKVIHDVFHHDELFFFLMEKDSVQAKTN